MLWGKSLTELRGIAQSFGVADIFQKDIAQLVQAIEAKQDAMLRPEADLPPRPTYDSRLMNKPPAKTCDRDLADEYLAPFVARGLNVSYDEERWYMSFGKKTDQGTLRMPPRHLLLCAERIMKSTRG